MISVTFVNRQNKLNWTENVGLKEIKKAYICHDIVVPSSNCMSFKSLIHDRAKLKPGPTDIIHQRLPIFYKTIIINVLEQKNFAYKASLKNRNLLKLLCTCLARRKQWLATPEKFKVIACAEFNCRQIAANVFLKFPLCITNLLRLIQTSLLLF